MKKIRAFGVALLITCSAAMGDSCNFNDRFTNKIVYRNVKTDPDSYQRPFKLQKKYKTNEKGMLEVYVGDDEKWYKVTKELRVNERSLNQMLKDEGLEIADKVRRKYREKEPVIKEYLNKIVETYKEIFGMEDGRAGKDSQ